ncbi:MAG: glycan-binding surface protein [Parabacteroides sp.]|nr:glycan-binding surface protein [Parabacteroides sp.]
MKSSNQYINYFLAAFIAVASFSITACKDEPDKFELTGGIPAVKYVRLPAESAADSLLTGAYMQTTVCLVGDNLRSICELYFNDQKATLNTSYMTDHTVLVDIPGTIPSAVTDKMYMITQGKDTVAYDFQVLVPAPQVSSMSCEYAAPGSEVTIYGDYLIDDPNVPLTITLSGNVPVTEIKDITKTAVSFVLPEAAQEGYITVESIYGSGRSQFRYRDTRNILFDWDASRGGMAAGHGWRNGKVRNADPAGIDDSYLYFSGSLTAGNEWANEDDFCFNYWPEPENGYPKLSSLPEFAEMLEKYGVDNLQLKFELYVPSSAPWQAKALQVMFTSNNDVTYATANNNYYGSAELPRYVWIPWQSTGSYDTNDQWITVTMKLADFNKNVDGGKSSVSLSEDHLTGLTIFVFNGGITGTECNTAMGIDNIRVVPIE